MGEDIQKNALSTLFHFVRAAYQVHANLAIKVKQKNCLLLLHI